MRIITIGFSTLAIAALLSGCAAVDSLTDATKDKSIAAGSDTWGGGADISAVTRRAPSRTCRHGSTAARSGMYRSRTSRPARLPQKSSKPATAVSTSLPEPPASASNSNSPHARSNPGFFNCKNIFYNLQNCIEQIILLFIIINIPLIKDTRS